MDDLVSTLFYILRTLRAYWHSRPIDFPCIRSLFSLQSLIIFSLVAHFFRFIHSNVNFTMSHNLLMPRRLNDGCRQSNYHDLLKYFNLLIHIVTSNLTLDGLNKGMPKIVHVNFLKKQIN